MREISWSGESAVEITGGGLRMIVVPGRGGKIVSLRDGAGTEWLLGPPDPLPSPARPADDGTGPDFVGAELCGWDECAPTIVAGRLPDGTELPDHGELWTAEADLITGVPADGAAIEITGRALPYRFRRAVRPAGSGLRLHYRVTAEGAAVPFLWAAHPQFLAPPGTRVELPATVDRVIDVHPGPATERSWDEAAAVIDTVPEGTGRKFYLPPDRPVGTVGLRRPDGRVLRLDWDPATVPYLGLWYDRRAFARSDVIALEPATGYYDALPRALAAGRLPVIPAGGTLEWTLRLTTGPI